MQKLLEEQAREMNRLKLEQKNTFESFKKQAQDLNLTLLSLTAQTSSDSKIREDLSSQVNDAKIEIQKLKQEKSQLLAQVDSLTTSLAALERSHYIVLNQKSLDPVKVRFLSTF